MSTYDIYLDASYTERKPFGFGYAQAVKVTGVSRVAQRFLKYLLTPLGSDPSGDIPGTEFSDLVGGNLADEIETATMVQLAVARAAEQLASAPAMSAPNLAAASVVRTVVTSTGLDVYLRLTTTEGDTAQLIVPVARQDAPRTSTASTPSYSALLQGL